MEFVVFVWLWGGVSVFVYGILSSLLRRRCACRGSGYTAGLGLLCAVLWFYLPAHEALWVSAAQKLELSYRSELFRGVWQLTALFRALWPSLGAAILAMALGESSNPQSGAYRAMKRFHHTKIVLSCLMMGLYGVLWFFRKGEFLQIALLNGIFYTACWYWRFGFHTIAYTLKKNGVPVFAGYLLLAASCIVAGSAFILPLMLIMGIGISDIWMDYHRRGSAKLLFTLQLK